MNEMPSPEQRGPVLDEASLELLTAEVTDEFMEQVNSGQQPVVEDYARRYPQIADVLRDLLPALRAMHWSASGSLPASDPLPDEAGVSGCLGDYRIRREIGRGGMGVVYEAEQISLGRRVALKVLSFAAALDSKQLERFKRESQAAAHLHHSNIVPVYSVGCERGVYYYAMQFIEGQSLLEVVTGLRRLAGHEVGQEASPSSTFFDSISYLVLGGDSSASPDFSGSHSPQSQRESERSDAAPSQSAAADRTVEMQAAISTQQSVRGSSFFRVVANLGIQAAEALEHAHAQDVVHRDVKPANLLVDIHGHLWVTDFGLARYQTDANLTMTGDILGTLRYMSPEQAMGKRGEVDHRTDIYSLGATLYELLTLRPVWKSRDRRHLLHEIAFDEPAPPRQFNSAIPTDLETIVLKALAKEPGARYGSSKELADDLNRFLEHKPILAKRPTLREMAAKWSRRHKSVVVSATVSVAVLLLMAVFGFAYGYVLLTQKQTETASALQAEAKQRGLAEQNFQQARQVLDSFVRLSEQELADNPDAQEVRLKLLESALKYYLDFVETCGDDPSTRADLAASLFRIAEIFNEIGSKPDAEAAFDQAREIREQLFQDHPADPEIQRGLFAIYRHLGVLRGHGRLTVVRQLAVQRHLHLAGEQVAIITELEEKWKENRPRFSRSSHSSRKAAWNEYRKQYEEFTKAADQEIEQNLMADQLQRLDQILLQLRGTRAFRDPEIAEAIGFTALQRQQIDEIHQEVKQAWKNYHRGRRSKTRVQQYKQQFKTERKNASEKLLNLLTAGQMAQWRQLAGEPFNGELNFGYCCGFRSRSANQPDKKQTDRRAEKL